MLALTHIVFAFDNQIQPQLTEGGATGHAEAYDDPSVADIRNAKGRGRSAYGQKPKKESFAHAQDKYRLLQGLTETPKDVGSPFDIVETVAKSNCRSTSSKKPTMEEISLLGVSAEGEN